MSALHEILASGNHSISFEFFPPKTEAGTRTLWKTIRRIEPLAPAFVSVTYGAGVPPAIARWRSPGASLRRRLCGLSHT